MNQLKTSAIVLARRNYRETDRIVSVLTPDYGKLGLVAKGSRALKSKLAGGIELFTLNEISFIKGRGELATLVSSRLETNFPEIIKSIDRVRLGYEFLKSIDRQTESEAEVEYFELLHSALGGLNDLSLSEEVLRLWFTSRLIAISGHSPNLVTDEKGMKLEQGGAYAFDSDSMSFAPRAGARFSANHIKYLRLAFASVSPQVLKRVNGTTKLASDLLPLINTVHNLYLIS